jgi:hypothetical protein
MSKRSQLEKRGAGQPQWSLAPMTMTVSYGQTSGVGASWFGPLAPLNPSAPKEVAGRQWDFPSGYNIATQPRSYEAVNFATLRGLADGYDLLRTIIETRKDQIERMEWSIRVRKKKQMAAAKPTVENDARIEAAETFFKKPDGLNAWSQWLRLVLEDLFVLDAPTLYIQRSVGGSLLGLMPLDGATIKRVVDDWGRTPTAFTPELDDEGKPTGKMIPPAAYQQVLKGLPAVNYTANELIYRPRNPRTNRAYGYSPVEQIIMTVNIALRRQMFLLNYYTEGNIPEALVGVPDTWTPNQIKEYQDYFDQMMSGDLAARRKLKFIPSGVGKTVTPTKEPTLKDDFDEWLARICCFAFSVSPTPFIKQMNRATAGTQKEQSDEEGLGPILMWIKSLIDDILKNELNSGDLEFAWGEDTQTDPVQEETILSGYTKSAILTLNQARSRLGEDPYTDPMADQPLVLTATGYVPLSAYEDAQKKAADAAQAASDALAVHAAAGTAPLAGGSPGAVAGPKVGNAATSAAGKPAGKAGADGSEAEKHAHAHVTPFNKRSKGAVALTSIPFDRKATRVAIAGIQHRLVIALGKWRTSLAKQVRKALNARGVQKTDSDNEDIAAEIAAELEFDGIAALANEIGVDLSDVAADSISAVIAQMGVTDAGDLVNQVNERAVAAARDRAAEMVGKKFNDEGDLVDNPDAQWAITDATRDALKDVIANGLDDNIGIDAIIDNIEALGGFSPDRAEMIAEAEVRRANSQGALDGYTAARDNLDIPMKKEWLLGPNPCEICQANADQGPIDLDEPFQSGDDAPPGHPWCECALAPVVDQGDVPNGAAVEPVAEDA